MRVPLAFCKVGVHGESRYIEELATSRHLVPDLIAAQPQLCALVPPPCNRTEQSPADFQHVQCNLLPHVVSPSLSHFDQCFCDLRSRCKQARVHTNRTQPATSMPSADATAKKLSLCGCYIGCCPFNLGDGLLWLIAQHSFSEVAEKLGAKLTLVQHVPGQANCKDSDFAILGGGSILRLPKLLEEAVRFRREHRPIFFFGFGWDDNGLAAYRNVAQFREHLTSPLDMAKAFDAWSPESRAHGAFYFAGDAHAVWTEALRSVNGPSGTRTSLVAGGVRGPISSAVLKTVVGSELPIFGDAGLLAARYWQQSVRRLRPGELFRKLRPFATHGLPLHGNKLPIVAISVGCSSDGQLLGNITSEARTLALVAAHLSNSHLVLYFSMFDADDACLREQVSLARGIAGHRHAANIAGIATVYGFHTVSSLRAGVARVGDVLRAAELAITHKLHAGVLAAAWGTPYLAIGYRPKHYDFAASIGSLDLVVPMAEGVLTPELLISKVVMLKNRRGELQSRFASQVQRHATRMSVAIEAFLHECIDAGWGGV